jgi:hypothetical protein
MRYALLMVVAACGGGSGDRLDAGDGTADAALADAEPAMTDAAPLPVCDEWPIVLTPAAGAQAAAEAELATLSPGTSLSWNANAGTVSTIFQLDLPLSGCVPGADVYAQVFALLEAHPALFQLDLDEWSTPAPYGCEHVPTQIQTLGLGRERLAGHVVQRDVFSFALRRNDQDEVRLTAVVATYLPPASFDLGETMDRCSRLTAAEAEAVTRATTFTTPTFFHCTPTGSVTYVPQASDTVEFADHASWTWDEGAGHVLLTGTRTMRLTVHPDHHTQELLDSAAACPVADPESDEYTVGWTLTFDVQTGALLSITPGLDCIVC